MVEGGVLKGKIKQMLYDIHFKGLFSVDYLVDKSGEWYFTEVNFHHDGHTYLITDAGINLPFLNCCAVTGENTNLHPVVKKRSFPE